MKVVWVLGAGFSRSLGGPLLQTMLSLSSLQELRRRYPATKFPLLHDKILLDVCKLYIYGTRQPVPRDPNHESGVEPLWDHAEEFLEHLDAAASEPKSELSFNRLDRISDLLLTKRLSHPEAPQLAKMLAGAARRFMAAECTSFLDQADITSERWQPYLRWATKLVEQDHVVITFNYDQVIEMLNNAPGVENRFSVQMPSAVAPTMTAGIPVLKLHGSVLWKRSLRQDAECPFSMNPQSPLETDDPRTIGIAAPGPSKRAACEDLRSLWTQAEAALREAESIIFIGYRFPPTDSFAREQLLGALAKNPVPHLRVQTVLGPNSSDAPRVGGLLDHALRQEQNRFPTPAGTQKKYTLVHQPMYAEDYLSVAGKNAIQYPF